MSEDPGLARLTYRRLRSAAGITDLPGLEGQVSDLEVAMAENRDLEGPLVAAVARVEQSQVPLLASRSRRAGDEPTDVA